MIEKDIKKTYINYCHNCGWFITDEKIEIITGNGDQIFFCQECGEELNKKLYNTQLFSILTCEKFQSNIDPTINNLSRIWGEFYGIIYKIIDLAVSKVYIGQTIQSLKKRFLDHLKNPPNKYFKAAVKRYRKGKWAILKIDSEHYITKGGEFSIEVIEYCKDFAEMNEKEILNIKKHKSCVIDFHEIINGKIIPLYGYNVDKGGKSYKSIKGPHHPLFRHLNESEFKSMIQQGFTITEICNEFRTSIRVVNKNIKYLWSHLGIRDINDARTLFGGLEEYTKRISKIHSDPFHYKRILIFYAKLNYSLLQDLLNNDLSTDEIDEIFMKKLLFIGFQSNEIGEKIGLNDSHRISERFQTIFGMNYQEARDEYFFKPRIINILKKGATQKQLLQLFNINYKKVFAPIKKVNRDGIYNAMRRIWALEYKEFKQRSIKEGKYIQNEDFNSKNRNQFTHFYKYLLRIYHVYPRINQELTEILIEGKQSSKDIDKKFLIHLIQQGYGLEELSRLYQYAYDPFRKWFKILLGMNYNIAKDTYYWKPKIFQYIKKFKIDQAIKKIGHKLKVSEFTIRGVIKRIWSDEIKNKSGIRSLLQYLKDESFYVTLTNLTKSFGDKGKSLKKYVLNSKKFLIKLLEISKMNSLLEIKVISEIAGITERSCYYHFSNKLIPFNIVVKENGDYYLTNFGKYFLRKLFN